MATSSEEVFERVCTPCKDYNNDSEAHFCCNQCGLLMCESCIENHQRLFRDHKQLGREEHEQWLSDCRMEGMLCHRHGRKIELRCVDHNKSCCLTCAVLDHRFCSTLTNIGTDINKSTSSELNKHFYSIKAVTTHSIDKSYSSYPVISSCCQTANGNIVLVDTKNKKLWEFNSQYSFVRSVLVQGTPEYVCNVDRNQIAVTTNSADCHEIHFLSNKKGNLSFLRKFSVDHMCCGITCDNNELYVCSASAVYVYDIAGSQLRTVFNSSGQTQRHAVALSKCGSRLYILRKSDCELVTTDVRGNELSKLTLKNHKSVCDLCIVRDGTVLVCADDAIFQVNSEGKRVLGTIAWGAHGISPARSVCLNDEGDELIVGRIGESIVVLNIEKTVLR